ncbi:hypothetical protein AB0M39_38020 [Streptomyces sp. NPDC051907]|uniref:hypothetical protein n=1 Tax=Streptomyces sp. NPDC051907 TaxID=3155284 RepID=UPI0034255BF5
MTTITSETGLLSAADLRSFASEMRRRFSDGQRMSVRGSSVVHAVDKERWLYGEMVPQPLCHTAVYGWSPTALRATRAPVSCMKCRRKLKAADEILPLYGGDYQPPLFTVMAPLAPMRRVA